MSEGATFALADAAAPALTAWADYVASTLSQIAHLGLPLMASPAPMLAALAAQPYLPLAAVNKVCRLHALVEGWVPHALDQRIVRVGQCFLARRSTGTCIFAK